MFYGVNDSQTSVERLKEIKKLFFFCQCLLTELQCQQMLVMAVTLLQQQSITHLRQQRSQHAIRYSINWIIRENNDINEREKLFNVYHCDYRTIKHAE